MAVRIKAPVIVTYDRSSTTPTFSRKPHSPRREHSIDSGIGFVDSDHLSSKSQGVIVTTHRRRFVRPSEPTLTSLEEPASPEQRRKTAACRDFVLFPGSNGSPPSQTIAPSRKGPVPAPKHPASRNEQRLARLEIIPEESGRPSSRSAQCGKGLPQPPRPSPARLPTPDIPEVDEESWWPT